mgnify:CR=1 FL=1
MNQQVGNLIDFYNVQFYNQGDTQYNTYTELFVKATGTFSGTSVSEIINRGIPSNKIVVGKPATQGDASNTGLVSASDLGNWCTQAFTQFGWYAGVFFWQFRSDMNGALIKSASSNLLSKVQSGLPTINTTTPVTNTTTTPVKNTTTPANTTNTTTTPTLNTTKPTTNTTTTPTTNTNTNTTPTNTTTTPVTPLPANSKISYPIRLAYVNGMNSWWPATAIAAGLGVPGYAQNHSYNYIVLAFWLTSGAADSALVWANPTMYMGTDSVFGKTTSDIQQSLKKLYNNAGVKIMVSAFGATENPTNQDPSTVATKLATFVNANNLDGVDIDY